VAQQIIDHEAKLETLKNELERANMVVRGVEGGNTAMQRFWETMTMPPVSSVGRPPVCYHSDSDHDDVDSLASVESITSAAV
jgi:hypothetical protein